jgi:hypothetical protein
MGVKIAALLLNATLFVGPTLASEEDPRNCRGAEWDDNRPLTVSRVTAPRVEFVKSPYDDDFKAKACPADTKECGKESFLVMGDVVLAVKTQGGFTCVLYQPPLTKAQSWITGWLPSSAVTPVAHGPSANSADWTGTWVHPGGAIEINSGDEGKLQIEGTMTLPMPSGDFQNGNFKAHASRHDVVSLTDEGDYGNACRVRMQRIDEYLLVEDNGGCGGSGVTFTGLYHHRK